MLSQLLAKLIITAVLMEQLYFCKKAIEKRETSKINSKSARDRACNSALYTKVMIRYNVQLFISRRTYAESAHTTITILTNKNY